MQGKKLIGVLLGVFLLGVIAGLLSHDVLAPLWAKGGYFCCTGWPEKPCVYAPDGDCQTPLQWCSEMREVDGVMTCAVW